jgi:antitoxin VapB
MDVTATAKIFTHGRSQAVRLPKEFRFEGREVRVTKVGHRVILEPMEPEESMPWATIDQLGDSPFMPEGREQPDAPADRAAFES